MITVEKALELIKSNVTVPGKTKRIAIEGAGGYVLSETVHSPINMPPFRQSAMDGYALHLNDGNEYTLIGEVMAGDNNNPVLKPGDAVRIFTGAPVPDTADAVVMQERVIAQKDRIKVQMSVSPGENIRPLGEQITAGSIALKKGVKLSPAAIGYLSGLGIPKVTVFEKPSIAVIATGNELVDAGQPLIHGKIYESNTKMLVSALYANEHKDVDIYEVEDIYQDTKELLQKVIEEKDVVLITGGISVGDYDFVGKAMKELEVEQVFYKVKQKPGKPLFFGKKNNSIVFALPGNPAAALTCFYIYVYPALERKAGFGDFSLPNITARSLSNFVKRGDRAQFLKATINEEGVEILDRQSSAMLYTFSFANALVYIPEQKDEIKIGDMVKVFCLPV